MKKVMQFLFEVIQFLFGSKPVDKKETINFGEEAFRLRDEIIADQLKIDQLQKQIDVMNESVGRS